MNQIKIAALWTTYAVTGVARRFITVVLQRSAIMSIFAFSLLWGHLAVAASFQLGVEAYSRGDYAIALHEFRALAKQGDTAALYILGVMYDNGLGVRQDYTRAFSWYRQAAEQGHDAAQYNLGVMYRKGQGVPQDNTQAFSWYHQAAEQGHAAAQNSLGVMYDNGLGVQQDSTQAFSWYRQAAEQGDAGGQYNLGSMYNRGRGIPQDYTQSYAWFSLAARQGHQEATEGLDLMLQFMTTAQVIEGQKRSRTLAQRITQGHGLDRH